MARLLVGSGSLRVPWQLDLRESLVRVRANAEGIALYRGKAPLGLMDEVLARMGLDLRRRSAKVRLRSRRQGYICQGRTYPQGESTPVCTTTWLG